MKILVISPVQTPIGCDLAGPADTLIETISAALTSLDNQVTVLAKRGSKLELGSLIEFDGTSHVEISSLDRKSELPTPANSLLQNMLDYALENQKQYDVILNTSYEWLPFYLTKFFNTKLVHLLTHNSVNDAMDEIIKATSNEIPNSVATFSNHQASTYGDSFKPNIVKGGVDLTDFAYGEEGLGYLAWADTITSDCGLENAIDAAQKTGHELHIIGKIVDEIHFRRCLKAYSRAQVTYHGSLDIGETQAIVGGADAFIVTSASNCAYQPTIIESLACGTPVIVSKNSAGAELIADGETGVLAQSNSPESIITAIDQIDSIERGDCRSSVEKNFSHECFANELENLLVEKQISKKSTIRLEKTVSGKKSGQNADNLEIF